MPQLNIENAQFRLHEKRLLNLPHFLCQDSGIIGSWWAVTAAEKRRFH